MRLFVALVPPDDALDHLAEHLEPRIEASTARGAAATRGAAAAGAAMRWTDRHQWHLTLAFLGDVTERRLDDLTDAVAACAARHDHALLRLVGAGTFPHPDAARVLWAGVETLRGDLDGLAHGIRSAANSVGATPDGTRFHPHVTLARFARPTSATRWLHALDPYEGPAWRTDTVTLVQSHLGEGRGRRPRYETVAELALR